VSDRINKDLAEAGGPHSNRCTGLSALMAISNRDFTSSKPTISSNRPCLFPMKIGLLFRVSVSVSLFFHRLNNLIISYLLLSIISTLEEL
jgi:hypothetical protein